MPDRSNGVMRAAALLTLHSLGLIAGVAVLVSLHAYGDNAGVGGVQLVLVAALGLSFLRVIPSVHRAAEADKASTPFALAAGLTVVLIGISAMVFARDSLAGLASFAAGLAFWNGWLNLLKGLIPLKVALAALNTRSPYRRGAASA
nr:hypothetical protein [uncultured Brevundimonas sp.]